MKYLLLILAFFVLLGAHQVTQDLKIKNQRVPTKAALVQTGSEYTEANKIKIKLGEVKEAMIEKRLLHELWMLTRNNKNGYHPLHIGLYISVKDQRGNPVHINRRKQGHLAHIILRGYDRNHRHKVKWNVKIVHRLIDMNNLSELMYE